jgi:hypothetical protein
MSEKVLAWIETIRKTPVMAEGGKNDLPLYYKVRDYRTSRDCFWNIAKYSFIYGDPLKWRALYEANKNILQNPNNPDLIQPGMRFTVPSIVGEKRSGEAIPEDHAEPAPSVSQPVIHSENGKVIPLVEKPKAETKAQTEKKKSTDNTPGMIRP